MEIGVKMVDVKKIAVTGIQIHDIWLKLRQLQTTTSPHNPLYVTVISKICQWNELKELLKEGGGCI